MPRRAETRAAPTAATAGTSIGGQRRQVCIPPCGEAAAALQLWRREARRKPPQGASCGVCADVCGGHVSVWQAARQGSPAPVEVTAVESDVSEPFTPRRAPRSDGPASVALGERSLCASSKVCQVCVCTVFHCAPLHLSQPRAAGRPASLVRRVTGPACTPDSAPPGPAAASRRPAGSVGGRAFGRGERAVGRAAARLLIVGTPWAVALVSRGAQDPNCGLRLGGEVDGGALSWREARNNVLSRVALL